MATKDPVVKSSLRQICQSSRLACKLIILGVDYEHETASNVRRMRSGRALLRTSACSRAIRHRIIRGQVRCASQQLGKLEGVVFYFCDVQRVPVPRASLLFVPPVSSTPFCSRFLCINPFLLLSRARSSMQPSQKLDDK